MKRRWLTVVMACVMVGTPLVGSLARRNGPPRCALDGVPIEPTYRVRLVADGEDRNFCCVRCARTWLDRAGGAATAFVTDEESGTEIAANVAVFVRSSIVTNRVTLNRVHAFRDRAAAERHVDQWGGVILEGDERPFGP